MLQSHKTGRDDECKLSRFCPKSIAEGGKKSSASVFHVGAVAVYGCSAARSRWQVTGCVHAFNVSHPSTNLPDAYAYPNEV